MTILHSAAILKTTIWVDASCPRFGSGEGKGELHESVRGTDLYLLVDVCNHSLTYSLNGYTNICLPMTIIRT